MPNIFGWIWSFYTFPVRQWKGGCSNGATPHFRDGWYPDCKGFGNYEEPDHIIGLLTGIFIYGFTLLFLYLAFRALYKAIDWRRKRGACQHCGAWTLDRSDGSWPSCVAGQPCCSDCVEKHIDAEVETRAQQEPRVKCPGCSTTMSKEVQNRVIIDVCPSCGAIYLSKEEMDEIKQLADRAGYKRGFDDGDSSGSSSGMIIGMALGSAIG